MSENLPNPFHKWLLYFLSLEAIPYQPEIMAGEYSMSIMRSYSSIIKRIMSGHGCPSLKLYHLRLIQSGAQEDNAVSVTWLGTAGVLVSDGLTGILIDPYVSRFGFLKVAPWKQAHS